MVNTNAVHTSDRVKYRSCRLQWDFSSPLRRNLEPRKAKVYLSFGQCMHRALQAYYDPTTPRDLMLARRAFLAALNEWAKKLGDMDSEDEQEYNESYALGLAMIEHYAEWAYANDNFGVEWVEQAYEVPIPGLDIPYGFKPDGLARDLNGRYWILEHKTTSKMPSHFDWLQMDDQPGSYIWGLRRAEGIKVEGVIYTFLRKKAPTPLRELKNGLLSVDKRVDTTFELAAKQIAQHHGEIPPDYNELLEYLRGKGNTFFIRETVRRNAIEIDNLERSIIMEAKEMTSNPQIYRNPTQVNCGSCSFVAPCIATYEGSDVKTLLEGNYRRREK